MANIYERQGFNDGNVLHATHLINMEDALIDLGNVVFATPSIKIDSTVYVAQGQSIILNFLFEGLVGTGSLVIAEVGGASKNYSVEGAGASITYKERASYTDNNKKLFCTLYNSFGHKSETIEITINTYNLKTTIIPQQNQVYNTEIILAQNSEFVKLAYETFLAGKTYSLMLDSGEVVGAGTLDNSGRIAIVLTDNIMTRRAIDSTGVQEHSQVLSLIIEGLQPIPLLFNYYTLEAGQSGEILPIVPEFITKNLSTTLKVSAYVVGQANSTIMIQLKQTESGISTLINVQDVRGIVPGETREVNVLLSDSRIKIGGGITHSLVFSAGSVSVECPFTLQETIQYYPEPKVNLMDYKFTPGNIAPETQYNYQSAWSLTLPNGGEITESQALYLRPSQTAVLELKDGPLSNENFIIEAYFKAQKIAKNAPVLTLMNNGTTTGAPPFKILYNRVLLAETGTENEISTPLIENTEKHVILEGSVAETNKLAVKVYIDGILSHYMEQPVGNSFFNQIQINGAGCTELYQLRVYNVPSERFTYEQNYMSCITDAVLLSKIQAQESGNTLDKYYFVENGKFGTNENDSKKTWISFDALHTINDKKSSKKSCVNCTVLYLPKGTPTYKYLAKDGTWIDLPSGNVGAALGNTDVYLQGTSSLKYPVKNYQLKNYNGENKSQTFNPFNDQSWTWKPDNKYTLKCDFMDSSHRNNTPTATFYDQVLSEVLTIENTPYSPPRQIDSISYRDTIAGRPCEVYYIAYPSDGSEPFNYIERLTSSESRGSYMFNLDKEAKALGFKLEHTVIDDSAEENVLNPKGYNCEEDNQFIYTSQDFFFAKENNIYNLTYGHKISEIQNLIGLEQYDNNPVVDENTGEIIAEYPTLSRFCVCCIKKESKSYSFIYRVLQESDIEAIDDTSFKFKDSFIDSNLLPICFSVVVTPKILNDKGNWNQPIQFYTSVESETNDTSSSGLATSFYPIDYYNLYASDDVKAENKMQHFTTSFGPRDSYYSEDEPAYYPLSFEPIDRAIKFFEACDSNLIPLKADRTGIFETLFDLNYCLVYYLQMLMFAQVDNGGKNSMMDSWDMGKIYPRPYDMDTQVGLDNEGRESINYFAEITSLGDTPANAPTPGSRKQYNTPNSRLWIFLWDYYKEKLIVLYKNLRANGIYEINKIMDEVDKMSSDIFGPTIYNTDSYTKYLTAEFTITEENKETKVTLPSGQYLSGSRRDAYYNFLEKRLKFLDSYFFDTERDLWSSGFGGKIGGVVSGASGPSAGFTVFLDNETAHYCHLKVGTESPYTTYFIPETPDYNDDVPSSTVKLTGLSYGDIYYSAPRGTHFWGVKTGTTFIQPPTFPSTTYSAWNSSNLEQIYQPIFPTNILDVDVASNIQLSNSIDWSQYPYLRKLDMSTTASSSVLKKHNITLANPTSIQYLNLTGQHEIKSLNLKNAYALTELLGIRSLNKLAELNIDSCFNLFKHASTHHITPTAEVLYIDGKNNTDFPVLTKLIINNCANLKKIVVKNHNYIKEIVCTNNPNLTEVLISDNPLLKTINLVDNTHLTTVTIHNNASLNSIKIPSGGDDYKQCKITSNTTLRSVNSDTLGTANFDGITFADNSAQRLYFSYSHSINKIERLTYDGPGVSMFAYCLGLHEVANCSFTLCGDAHSMFYDCGISYPEGIYFNNTSFNGKPTNLDAFIQFAKISCSEDKHFLRDILIPSLVTGNNLLTSLSNPCYSCSFVTTSGKSIELTNANLSDLFNGCSSLDTIAGLFSGGKSYKSVSGKFTPGKNCSSTSLNLEALFAGCSTSAEGFTISEPFIPVNGIDSIDMNNLFSKTYSIDYDDVKNIENIKQSSCRGNLYFSSKTPSIFYELTGANIHSATIQAPCIYAGNNLLDTAATPKNIASDLAQEIRNKISPIATELDGIFFGTNLNIIPQHFFGSCPSLESAIGCFSMLTDATFETPNQDETFSLFISGDGGEDAAATLPALNLAGLFFGSEFDANVQIPETLFAGGRKRITSLGTSSIIPYAHSNNFAIYLKGAFGNTTFTTLPNSWRGGDEWGQYEQLTNISFLFASNIKDYNKHYSTNKLVNIFTISSDDNYPFEGEIGTNIFADNLNLSQVTGVFFGNHMEFKTVEIDESGKVVPMFGSSKLTTLNHIFAGNNIINCPLRLIQDNYNTKIRETKSTFYGVTFSTQEQFTSAQEQIRAYTALEDARGIFNNVKLSATTSGTPALQILPNLFENHRALRDVSYGFANTSLNWNDDYTTLSINSYSWGDLQAALTPEKILTYQGVKIKTISYNATAKSYQVTYLDNSLQDIDKSFLNNPFIIKVIDNEKPLPENGNSLRYYYGNTYPTDIFAVQDTDTTSRTITVQTNNTDSLVKWFMGAEYMPQYIYALPSQGIFNNCEELQNVTGLFYNSNFNQGCLPQNLFYSNKPFNKLKSLSSLFQGATWIGSGNLISTTQEGFLHQNWFEKLSNKEIDFSCMFAGITNQYFNNAINPSPCKLILPDNAWSNGVRFSGCFANLGKKYYYTNQTDAPDFTPKFFQQNLTKYYNGMYMGTFINKINMATAFPVGLSPNNIHIDNLYSFSNYGTNEQGEGESVNDTTSIYTPPKFIACTSFLNIWDKKLDTYLYASPFASQKSSDSWDLTENSDWGPLTRYFMVAWKANSVQIEPEDAQIMINNQLKKYRTSSIEYMLNGRTSLLQVKDKIEEWSPQLWGAYVYNDE